MIFLATQLQSLLALSFHRKSESIKFINKKKRKQKYVDAKLRKINNQSIERKHGWKIERNLGKE